MFLGVLFFIQVIGLGYLIIADPFHVRPLVLMMWQASSVHTNGTVGALETSGTAPLPAGDSSGGESSVVTTPETSASITPAAAINADQAKALQSVGLSADAIANITPAQEACFVSILGATRVNEVKAGAVPTASEFFSVRSCL